MARSKWKLNYFSNNILRKSFFLKLFVKGSATRLIFTRSSSIPFWFLGKVVKIHKGNCFSFFLIDYHNIGYKFGEFSITKKPFHYPLKKKKK